MDEGNLKKILQNQQVPSSDPNAKKRAVNLAVAEFKAQQQKKQKLFQGLPILSRLMGNSNTHARRDSMEQVTKRRLVYGGMATAMVVVLIAGASVTQMKNFGKDGAGDDLALHRVEHLATQVASVSQPQNEAPANMEAVREESDALTEGAIAQGSSQLPTPVEPPVGRLALSEKKGEALNKMAYNGAQPQAVPSAMPARENTLARAQSDVAAGVAQGWAGAPMASIAPMPYPEQDTISPYYHDEGRDKFEEFKVNPIKVAKDEPVSTFSADVDTASYSFTRRMINQGVLPPADAVRVEEMINYFDYNYPGPDTREQPFKANVVVTDSPWAEGKKLIHIGIKGYDIGTERPHSNLVFLLDVSGSMNEPDKLPLVKSSMKMLLSSLKPDDTVAIVVYAGAAGTVLEPTKVSEQSKILNAIDSLTPGGSTAGAEGINLAYQLAQQNFNKEGVNRIILATDGDFNVGVSDPEGLQKLVEEKRKTGIFLSVLGFGQGNLNDQTMQRLAQNGNGVAAYIDTLNEARKILVEEASSTLFPIAKDVKLQVEFNPDKVAEYRLVGYETRHLNREDFNNDKVDAGDIGAGHTVTAIYEITPVGGPTSVDPLRYGAAKPVQKHEANTNFGQEYAFLKIRYKLPDEDTSHLITTPVKENEGRADADTDFSTAVAAFGQILEGGQHTGKFSYDDVIALAEKSKGEDKSGKRAEFINLVKLAKTLAGNR